MFRLWWIIHTHAQRGGLPSLEPEMNSKLCFTDWDTETGTYSLNSFPVYHSILVNTHMSTSTLSHSSPSIPQLVPVSEVHIELASRHVELYSAQLRIHAMFSGLRYFMYYYPLSAASVGIGICMVFLSTVVILSWYQFSAPSTLSPTQPMMVRNWLHYSLCLRYILHFMLKFM